MNQVKFKQTKASSSTGFLFWQVSTLWQRSLAKALSAHDLTHIQFVLLASIGWLSTKESKPITQSLLAAHAKTDIMMTSKVIRTLLAKKLISRRDHPQDSRAYSLSLTQAGVAKTQKALAVVEAIDEQFFSILTNQETFKKSLINLIESHTKE